MHVVDPQHYPLSQHAAYSPTPHTLSQALDFYETVNIHNVVLVQPSIYGNDNSCLLDALKEFGAHRARGVVTFDPETIEHDTLREWHELGVRGARVNLKSVGAKVTQEEFDASLRRYAEAIRPLDWALQLYVSMDVISMLEPIVPSLDVKVCIDHFGHPDLPPVAERTHPVNPHDLPGFRALTSLLRQGNTWVKISAPYRIDDDAQMSGVEPLAKELLHMAPHRTVFATDWPHTRFEGVDIKPFIEACLGWCSRKEGLAERLFRRNAEELWSVVS